MLSEYRVCGGISHGGKVHIKPEKIRSTCISLNSRKTTFENARPCTDVIIQDKNKQVDAQET